MSNFSGTRIAYNKDLCSVLSGKVEINAVSNPVNSYTISESPIL